MATAPAQLMPGRKLGRYQLTARMAVGGMAEVWLAKAVGISGFTKMVVVKTILPHLAVDPTYVEMFQREAVIAANLNHTNIVQIYELGEAEGINFIAMEHLLGRTLRQLLRKAAQGDSHTHGHLLPPWLVINVITAVCDALEYAHTALGADGKPMNLVHRDVTPDNIMVTFAGSTKVLDFGIAKGTTATGDSSHTSVGTLRGKFSYVAPERISAAYGNGTVDARADVFSVGAMLYKMLTGVMPFVGADEVALLRGILEGVFVPVREVRPALPVRLEELVHRALAKDPVARGTSGQLAEDLRRFMASVRKVATTERHVGQYVSLLFPEDVGAATGSMALEAEGFDPTKRDPSEVPRVLASTEPFNAALVDAIRIDADPCVLVVDGDRVSRRFVELALARGEAKYVVVAVASGKEALEVMRTRLVDLIISEAELPDMKAVDLVARVSQVGPHGATPFIMLSAETRVATRVAALKAGADAFLLKPCDPLEVQARVAGLLERQRRLRWLMRQRPYLLAGSFSTLPFQTLAGILEMERRSGTLAISGAKVVGEVGFEEGRVVHAKVGEQTGDEAFYRLMQEPSGQFEFALEQRQAMGTPLTLSATELLMEAALRADHQQRDSQGKTIEHKKEVLTEPEPDASLIAPSTPSQALGEQFELGVRDGFALGELRLSGEDELIAWMLSPTGDRRFHVHLVADMGEAVAAMLSLAAPLTELVGLGAEAKLLSLDFFLRNEQLLDVLLLDLRRPAQFRECLIHRPSLYIIAPPGGDFLSVGTDVRVQLEELLSRLRPRVVLGVGHQSMMEALPQLPYLRRPDVRTASISGVLGKGLADLRSILVYGIRLWAAPSDTTPAQASR